MTKINNRRNSRSYLEQSILNNFPEESKARWFRYSVAAQLVHPFAGAIEELSLNQEKFWHNIYHSTVDPNILDVIYEIPYLFDGEINSIQATAEGSSFPVNQTESDLDNFYYSPKPTRISLVGTDTKEVYPTRPANSLRTHEERDCYLLEDHIFDQALVSIATDIDWTIETTDQITFQANGGVGNQSYLQLKATNIANPFLSVVTASTNVATGKTLAYQGWFRDPAPGSTATSFFISVGYQGVGTAFKEVSISPYWSNESVIYEPPDSTTTGVPFARILYPHAPGSTGQLDVSDSKVFDYGFYNNLSSTSVVNRDWSKHDPNWAYVIVSGADNLLDTETDENRPDLPASILIEGINAHGHMDTERVFTPYNGTHRSIKQWKQITSTRVDGMSPWSANVSVQLQNYASTAGILDQVNSYITPYFEAPLFYSFKTDNGSSFLGHDSFVVDDLPALINGYDAIIPRYYMELVDDNNQSYTVSDITYDVNKRYIYALDASTKTVHAYEPEGHWPSSTALQNMRLNSTPFPDMKIRELEENEYICEQNNSVELEANWRNRYKRLVKNRWTVIKPDGTVVGLLETGTEVASTTDYWITNFETEDPETKEFKFKPQRIPYTCDQVGDYVITLETEYLPENQSERITEKDSVIVSVVQRSPIASFILPTSEIRSPIGIDMNPKGELTIAYSQIGNTFIIDEEKYRLKYDYFFTDETTNRIYFREKYNSVSVTSL